MGPLEGLSSFWGFVFAFGGHVVAAGSSGVLLLVPSPFGIGIGRPLDSVYGTVIVADLWRPLGFWSQHS